MYEEVSAWVFPWDAKKAFRKLSIFVVQIERVCNSIPRCIICNIEFRNQLYASLNRFERHDIHSSPQFYTRVLLVRFLTNWKILLKSQVNLDADLSITVSVNYSGFHWTVIKRSNYSNDQMTRNTCMCLFHHVISESCDKVA